MILSDKSIEVAIKDKEIVIKPFDKKAVGSASLDLSLGNTILVYKKDGKVIDTKDLSKCVDMVKLEFKDEEQIILQPGDFILGVTLEEVELPASIAARVDGRSSLGRLGLAIHSTAGHVDPGFKGKIVLEMSNVGIKPIALYPKMKICQLVFERLDTPTDNPYNEKKGAKYTNVKDVEGSKL